MNFQKVIVYLGLLLDVVGIAVLIPAFPELKAYYGINDFQVTLGLTAYSLFAFFGAPILGQLSDKFGRKKILSFCITGTTLSYALLLISGNFWIFLVSRILNGVTGGNISILQAILTDISPDPETKSKNFGLMGAFFGLGFIIGPLIGSFLLKISGVEGIFRFGLIFGAIELALIVLYFQNTNHQNQEKHVSFNVFSVFSKYLRKETMRNFLLSLFFLGVGGFIINASLSLFMHDVFGTSGVTYGYFLAFAGVISALNMGLFIPKFRTKNFSIHQLIIRVHISLIVGYLLLGSLSDYTTFIMLFYLVTILSGIYMPIYNIQIMSQAKPDEIGELSGMLGGAQSLFMFFGPLIGGLLLTYGGNIFRGAVFCFVCSGLFMFKWMIKAK